MRRREFIALLGAASLPLTARAQQPAMPVIGLLSSASSHDYLPMIAAFRNSLGAAGFVGLRSGSKFLWGDEQYDGLPALASDLVRGQEVNVIVAASHSGGAGAETRDKHYPDCVCDRRRHGTVRAR